MLILEDDPYCDLRYSGIAEPAIKSLDEDETVIYLLSFSKIISPGLRVGAAAADSRIINKFNIAKQGEDLHTANLSQELVDAFMRSGQIQAHIEKIRALYSEKRDAMLEELETFPKGITHTQPDGGLFIWAWLPAHMDAEILFKKCVEAGVAFVPGTHFYPEGGHKNTMRLNFSMASLDQIREGMAKLKKALQENMSS